MPWTVDKDQRLFMIIADIHKLDHQAIADEWQKRYPNEPNGPPTASAISQHINQVKKKTTGKTGDAAKGATPRKPPVTPRKATTPKDPTSSAKRKRTTMSEDDDSEPDMSKVKLSENGAGRRGPLSRVSKESPKKYEESSKGEEGDDEADMGLSQFQHNLKDSGPNDTSIFDDDIDFDGTREHKPAKLQFDVAKDWRGEWMPSQNKPSKSNTMRSRVVDSADESDVSNFSEGLR